MSDSALSCLRFNLARASYVVGDRSDKPWNDGHYGQRSTVATDPSRDQDRRRRQIIDADIDHDVMGRNGALSSALPGQSPGSLKIMTGGGSRKAVLVVVVISSLKIPKCQTPLHGHRLRTCCTTPPTDKLTTILQLVVQQICHIAMPEPNISTSQGVGMWQIFVRWW